jgi:hypothetical protein
MTPEERELVDVVMRIYTDPQRRDINDVLDEIYAAASAVEKAAGPEPEEPLRWVSTVWRLVHRGDTIRLREGGSEVLVEGISVRDFKVRVESTWDEEKGRWWDGIKGGWEHREVNVRLAGRAPMPFLPDGEVQILMNAERHALWCLNVIGGETADMSFVEDWNGKVLRDGWGDKQPQAYYEHQRRAADYRRQNRIGQ